MSSFYGGKQGKSYNIVKRYNSILSMLQDFALGDSCEVGYGLHVIIDTLNKNNFLNGLLFRRDFYWGEIVPTEPSPVGQTKAEFEEEFRSYLINGVGRGAKYVGQIVGPQGLMTEVNVIDWETFTTVSQSSGYGSTGSVLLQSTRLGKDGNLYNDKINFGYVNILDSQNDIAGCYLSFDFPKTVVLVSGEEIVPYFNEENHSVVDGTVYNYHTFADNTTAVLSSASLIALNPNSGPAASTPHPFYYKFNVAVPKGKDGTLISSVYISTSSSHNSDYWLQYDYVDYSTSSIGDTYLGNLLGAWRVIEKIDEVSGTSYVAFTTGEVNTYKIGDCYTNTVDSITYYNVCIKDGSVEENTQLPVSTVIGNLFDFGTSKWRTVVNPGTNVNFLDIDYTAGINSTIEVKNLDYITLADNGDLYATYTKGSTTESNILGHTRQIEDISISNENENGAGYDYSKGTKVKVKYKDNTEYESHSLNTVLDIHNFGDHLGVLYSDPDARAIITSTMGASASVYQANWTDPISGTTYSSIQYDDIGMLQGQYHVGGIYTAALISTTNTFGLNGFQDGYHNGWIITIYEINEQGNKVRHLYAFDERAKANQSPYYYSIKESTESSPTTGWSYWYKLTNLFSETSTPESHIIATTSLDLAKTKLQTNGFWLVVEER